MSKLSSLETWSYATGSIPQAGKDAAFINFVVFYYTQITGLSGTLTGLAMLMALSRVEERAGASPIFINYAKTTDGM